MTCEYSFSVPIAVIPLRMTPTAVVIVEAATLLAITPVTTLSSSSSPEPELPYIKAAPLEGYHETNKPFQLGGFYPDIIHNNMDSNYRFWAISYGIYGSKDHIRLVRQ